MVERIGRFGDRRYVGDRVSKLVHDRWHEDSQGCGIEDLIAGGTAVGFNPDTLEEALLSGFEYCEGCHDKSEPTGPPKSGLDAPDVDRGERGRPPSALPRSDKRSRTAIPARMRATA
jgi:hypothetical protein